MNDQGGFELALFHKPVGNVFSSIVKASSAMNSALQAVSMTQLAELWSFASGCGKQEHSRIGSQEG